MLFAKLSETTQIKSETIGRAKRVPILAQLMWHHIIGYFLEQRVHFHSILGNHHCTNNFKVTSVGAMLSKKLDIKSTSVGIK